MKPAFVVEIVTPKKYLLNGLWFGPKKPKRAIVCGHALGSSMFSKLTIADHLVEKDTAILAFNNRGHDKVASVSSGRNKRVRGGAAHEKFTECVDDIQGAINFAKRSSSRKVYLAGHSTGCQKSIYWASKKQNEVKGIILLAPMSDYAAAMKIDGAKNISTADKVAQKMMRSNRRHMLLPEHTWQWSQLADAQRFISLYSGKGPEEIFTYWDSKRKPRTLQSVRIPTLVLLAEKDEYGDRPAKKIVEWFDKNIQTSHRVHVIPGASHSFKGKEKTVARKIKDFIS